MKESELRNNIIESIKRDIKSKKLKKMLIGGFIGTGFSLLTYMVIFITMLITNLSILANLAPILVFSIFGSFGLTIFSFLETKRIITSDSYKDYCNEYEVIKNKKNIIYKVKTKDNKVIYLDENEKNIFQEFIGDLNKEIPKEQNQESISEIEEETLKEQNQEYSYQSSPTKTQIPKITNNKSNSAKYFLLNLQEQKYNQAIGREKELVKLEESLIMNSVCPLIIGPPGVGKTALVKGLVYKIQKGEVPEMLKDKKIGQVDVTDLVSNTRYVGDFESKMQNFINFAKKEDAVFFIDEFHTIIGSGQGSKSNLDGANILKPYLSSGQIKIIGATTEEEYEKIIKTDGAFNRRFDIIRLGEPDDKTLCEIIDSHIKKYENNYKVDFPKGKKRSAIIQLLVELTSLKHRNYKNRINNPSLVLSIVERCFVKAKMQNSKEVTITHISEALSSNENLYESVIERTICKFNKLKEFDTKEESFQKVIKFNQNK